MIVFILNRAAVGEKAATDSVRRTSWIFHRFVKDKWRPAQQIRIPGSPSHKISLQSLTDFLPQAFAECLCKKIRGRAGGLRETPLPRKEHKAWWRLGAGKTESSLSEALQAFVEKGATLHSWRRAAEREPLTPFFVPPLWGVAVQDLLCRANKCTETLWASLGPHWVPSGGSLWWWRGRRAERGPYSPPLPGTGTQGTLKAEGRTVISLGVPQQKDGSLSMFPTLLCSHIIVSYI